MGCSEEVGGGVGVGVLDSDSVVEGDGSEGNMLRLCLAHKCLTGQADKPFPSGRNRNDAIQHLQELMWIHQTKEGQAWEQQNDRQFRAFKAHPDENELYNFIYSKYEYLVFFAFDWFGPNNATGIVS